MQTNSNVPVISFFLLILAEKKSGLRQHQFFQTYLIETIFYIKYLISEKQCGFSFAQNHSSHMGTRKIIHNSWIYLFF